MGAARLTGVPGREVERGPAEQSQAAVGGPEAIAGFWRRTIARCPT
jgi:hypothetical protein